VAHALHAAPPAPHEFFDSEAYGTHVPLAVQQPFGQEAASQTHWPVVTSHSCPEGHAAHAAPPAPHDVLDSLDRASHVPAAVQQPEHDPPPHEQVPLEHEPVEHTLHVAPPVPHCEPDCEAYGTHVLPLQHPLAQEVVLHTHCPLFVSHT